MLAPDLLEEGLGQVTSPGRLQLVGIEPTVIVDAAHNPHGAQALAEALGAFFDFDEIVVVVALFADKDARGLIEALNEVATRFHVTRSDSERARPVDELADQVSEWAGEKKTHRFDDVEVALASAREWAAEVPRRGVIVTGSISLVGQTIAFAEAGEWMQP